MNQDELYVLSYYRACELAGSILFGRLAMHTSFDRLRSPLTHHCLEEAEHAWLWTKVIEDLAETPLKITDPYQTEYGKEYGMPSTIVEILCLTQVFEKRTLQHFSFHRDLPGTHPRVREALQKMIDDEEGHIGWVRDELDAYERTHPGEVSRVMAELEAIDRRVYARLLEREAFANVFGGGVDA